MKVGVINSSQIRATAQRVLQAHPYVDPTCRIDVELKRTEAAILRLQHKLASLRAAKKFILGKLKQEGEGGPMC